MALDKNRKDGLHARPFLLAGLLLTAFHPARAREDWLESALGLSYGRDIWMNTDLCADQEISAAIPGLEREGAPCSSHSPGAETTDPVSGSWSYDYRNLLRKTGTFSFAQGGASSAWNLRVRPVPGIDIRSSLERYLWDRNIGDSALRIDQNGSGWDSRNAVAFPFSPGFVPVVAVGGDGREGWDKAIALHGSSQGGFSWSLLTGQTSREFPMSLKVGDTLPATPFALRQDFHAFSLAFRPGPVGAAWTGKWTLSRRPGVQRDTYALSDSGWRIDQTADLNYGAPRLRMSLSGSYTEAQHFFQGLRRGENYFQQFTFAEARQRDYSLRADVRTKRGRWKAGVFAGTSGLYWDALRPGVPAGKYLWYPASVFDVFNRETWLFDGNLRFEQWAAGCWGELPLPLRWRGRFGLRYNRLDLRTGGRLTQKTSVLLLAYTLEESYPDFPGVRAHLLTPELRLSWNLGRAFLEGFAEQTVPLSVHFRRGDGGTNSGSGGGGLSGYSGGTRAGFSVGWGLR